MTASYRTIYSRFLGKMRDYKFLALPEEPANEFMSEWLDTVISQPFFRKLFKSFSAQEETIDFELYDSIDEAYDTNFVIEVIACGVAVSWLTPKVNSLENIDQVYGGSEEKFYSQANHLSQLQSLLFDLKNCQRKLIRDHGYGYEVLNSKRGE